ncbi:MAG: SpoIIE family protein phosphatase [Bacteroidota bacterium]
MINENIDIQKPLVLIVDGSHENIQTLSQMLLNEGYNISSAASGVEALGMLEKITPDIILLEVMMPELDGFKTCELIKNNPRLKDIPVFFLTPKSGTENIIRVFKTGGVDFVSKPYEKEELLVRMHTQIELKKTRDKLEKYFNEIAEINKKLINANELKDNLLDIIEGELASAAEYVRSLMPRSLNGKNIGTQWLFAPSSKLGGDSFGYQMLDKDNLAVYLIDVSGHGVKAALYSVSVLNMLNYLSLPNTDFTNPEAVLYSLNNTYQMSSENDMYFSIWYGIYNLKSRILTYSSAGHPPALLVSGKELSMLGCRNMVIGGLPKIKFVSKTVQIPPSSDLYIFSDGVYEVKLPHNTLWNYEDFSKILYNFFVENQHDLEDLYKYIVELTEEKKLRDDFSILKLIFR